MRAKGMLERDAAYALCRSFVGTAILLAAMGVAAVGCSGPRRASAVHAKLPVPRSAPAFRRAAAIAAKVQAHARRTEKAEGKQDLVKDSVAVKSGPGGAPVIEQRGEASYYGRRFRGRKTASGRPFQPRGLTAAHPTLPLGTQATVTNLDNGKSVHVTVTDRGPYARGRDIDLSKTAAERIDIHHKNGAAPVQIDAEMPTPRPTDPGR